LPPDLCPAAIFGEENLRQDVWNFPE